MSIKPLKLTAERVGATIRSGGQGSPGLVARGKLHVGRSLAAIRWAARILLSVFPPAAVRFLPLFVFYDAVRGVACLGRAPRGAPAHGWISQVTLTRSRAAGALGTESRPLIGVISRGGALLGRLSWGGRPASAVSRSDVAANAGVFRVWWCAGRAAQQAAEADGRKRCRNRSAVPIKVPWSGSPMVSFMPAAA